MEYEAMSYVGRACRSYGGRISSSSHLFVSQTRDPDDEHLISCLTPNGSQLQESVKYSGTSCSWIAIRMQECIVTVTHIVSQANLEKLDLFKFSWDPFYNVVAVVSSILGNGERQDGCGFATSFAKFNEKAAISFLRKALRKRSEFTFEDTVQLAISAFRYLFPGDIKADEIQISVMKKDQQVALPIVAIEALLKNESINFCSFLSPPIISILQRKVCAVTTEFRLKEF